MAVFTTSLVVVVDIVGIGVCTVLVEDTIRLPRMDLPPCDSSRLLLKNGDQFALDPGYVLSNFVVSPRPSQQIKRANVPKPEVPN